MVSLPVPKLPLERLEAKYPELNTYVFACGQMFDATSFLTEKEKDELVTNCDRLARLRHSSACPYAFSESGVAMLSAILRSEIAVKTSVAVMNAFVAMRHYLADNAMVFQRLDRIELKQLEADEKFRKIFSQLEQPDAALRNYSEIPNGSI